MWVFGVWDRKGVYYFYNFHEAHKIDILPRFPQRGPEQRDIGVPRVRGGRSEYFYLYAEYDARKEFFKNKQKQWLDQQIE
jgi:hypothetical protein